MFVDMQRIRFLVVDDMKFMRRLIRAMLEGFGAKDICEISSTTAADLMRRVKTADFVIMDWLLRGSGNCDGLDLVRSIRAFPDDEIARKPIIMISAYGEPERVIEAMTAGVNDYLRKPVSAKDLYERIVHLVSDPKPYIDSPEYHGPLPRSAPCRKPRLEDGSMLAPSTCPLSSLCRACQQESFEIHYQDKFFGKFEAKTLPGRLAANPQDKSGSSA